MISYTIDLYIKRKTDWYEMYYRKLGSGRVKTFRTYTIYRPDRIDVIQEEVSIYDYWDEIHKARSRAYRNVTGFVYYG